MADLTEHLQSTLGNAYTIARELGGGGMSRVFVATETALGREIVIKVLPPESAGSVSVERFKREIAVAARLQHPHIVPLLMAGESHGLPFYSMPFVRGDSLRTRLSRGGELSVNESVHILRDVAGALAYAHAQGIVHRDIKPDNVILSGGVAVVTDFGVAKAVDLAATGAGQAPTGLTSVGVALGTPAYMSPEQATADPHVDHRADIYAFGCVAYEMLAGVSPFAGRPLQQLIAAQVATAPDPIESRRPGLPPALAALIMACLAKRPGDRPQTADAIIHSLDALATPRGGSDAMGAQLPAVTRGPSRMALVIAATVVVATATLSWVAWQDRAGNPLVLGAVKQLTRSANAMAFDAAISPDGKLVAYTSGTPGSMRLYVRQISGSAPLAIAPKIAGNHQWPSWSPDGTQLAFVSQGAIYITPSMGGTPRLFTESGTHPAWSPDGTQIAFGRGSALMVVPVEGGPGRVVLRMREPHSIAWSPDGSRLAFVDENSGFARIATYGNASPSTIWTVSVAGGDSAAVTTSTHLNLNPVWLEDGRSALFISSRDGPRDIYWQRLSADGRPRGEPERVTSGLEVGSMSIDRSASMIAYATLRLRASIWMAAIPPTGAIAPSAIQPVTSEKEAIEGMALSHDGKWLAYDSDRNGNMDIFKIAFDGKKAVGDPIQLTTNAAADFEPRWSPDDSELVFYSRRFGTRDIFTMKADGRGEVRLTDMTRHEYYPDWSPDGTRIAFWSPDGNSTVGDNREVFLIERKADSSWTAPRNISTGLTGVGQMGRWSADSRWIALFVDSSLALLSADGGPVRRIVEKRALREGVTFISWGPDPSRLYFQTRDSTGIFSIWTTSVDGTAPRRLLKLSDPVRRTRRVEFDTDGKNLFFTIAADESDIAVASLTKR